MQAVDCRNPSNHKPASVHVDLTLLGSYANLK